MQRNWMSLFPGTQVNTLDEIRVSELPLTRDIPNFPFFGFTS